MEIEELVFGGKSIDAGLLQGDIRTDSGGVLFENERFTFGEIQLGKKLLSVPDVDSVMIQSVFFIDPESQLHVTCRRQVVLINTDEHNMFAFGDLGCMKVSESSTGRKAYYIAFSKEALVHMFGEIPSVFKLFQTGKIALGVLAKQNLRITPEMSSIIDEIVSCKRVGLLRNMFLEAKILKLIMLQLEQFQRMERKTDVRLIKEYDIEKIHHARIILESSISHSVSLVELAHLVGLNDFKLKRGFKEIYHSTVYGYLYELRMEEAKRMLLGTDCSINEIASNCGYEFVQSFIKAFKRKFGVSPEKFRNKIKAL